jgi:hypothetical protein
MGNVYIEARPKGRPEGSHIEDYVVEDHADSVLATFKTQRDAVVWAQKQGHSPLVARVRHVNARKSRTNGGRLDLAAVAAVINASFKFGFPYISIGRGSVRRSDLLAPYVSGISRPQAPVPCILGIGAILYSAGTMRTPAGNK